MKTSIYYISIIVVFTLLAFPLASVSTAQVVDEDIPGGIPRLLKLNARTGAMGDATVADPTDVSSININPAALSFVRDFRNVQVNIFQNWNNNLMLENITVPAFRRSGHHLAAQLGIHHKGYNTTNLLGRSTLFEPQIRMYQFDLAYAYSVDNVLSFGIFNNITYAENDVAQYWTYYPTFGIIYAPSQSISYGIAFRGLGRSVGYNFVDLEDGPVITTLRSINLRESLELGATLQFPIDTDQTYLSLSLANEKRFGEEGIWYKAGLEWKSVPFAALRGGLLFQPERSIYAPRLGLGIITSIIEFDYMVSHSDRLVERYHQMALTFHF